MIILKKRQQASSHHKDVEQIKKYMESIGYYDLSPKLVEEVWREFSETYCAGFLCVDDKKLKSLRAWLNGEPRGIRIIES